MPALFTLLIGFILTWSVTREADLVSHEEAFGKFEAHSEILVDRLKGRLNNAIVAGRDMYTLFQKSPTVNNEQFLRLAENFSGLNTGRDLLAFVTRSYESTDDKFIFKYIWSPEKSVNKAKLTSELNQSDLGVSFLSKVIESHETAAIPLPDSFFTDTDNRGKILLAHGYNMDEGAGAVVQIIDGMEMFDGLAQGERFKGMGLQLSSVFVAEDGEELELSTSVSEQDEFATDDDYLISVHSFKFGDQSWNAVSWSTEEIFKVDHFRVQAALLVCVILTALVYYIVWSQLERTRRVSSIVDRRTRALKKANDELAEHYEVLQDLNSDLFVARKSAEAASRAKSEFLATMSHELRTPLNAILGFSQILKDQVVGPLGDERYVEYSNDIHASGGHLLGLINDILDLAKLEANQLMIENHDVYPSDLLDSVKSLITPKFAEKNVTLKLELSDDMPQPIVGDDLRLKQIIVNLLSNAIKFTDEGSIDVRLYPKAFENKDNQSGYMIEVRDTGIGIPEEKQSLLFQRFTQIDAALTRKHGGVGLGLAICHELTTKMGGTISVESQSGEGTVFFVHLPLEEASAADTDDDMMI